MMASRRAPSETPGPSQKPAEFGPAMPQALRHPFEGRSVVGPGEASDAAHSGLSATKESSIPSSAVGDGGAMHLGPACRNPLPPVGNGGRSTARGCKAATTTSYQQDLADHLAVDDEFQRLGGLGQR